MAKAPTTTHTVCLAGPPACDFSNIQAAIDSGAVIPGDTLSLAAETFTESITISKTLNIKGAGAENTILQAAETPGIATSRVITVTKGVNVTIQGLTVQYGVAVGDSGGGIDNKGVLTLTHSIIYSNTTTQAGGGINNDGGSIIVVDVTLLDNSSGWEGGGMDCNEGDASLRDVVFTGNSASGHGGGLRNDQCNLVLATGAFSGNSSTLTGGGMYGSGSLSDVVFSYNSATTDGGGLFCGGTLTNVKFINNSAENNGGGLYGKATLTNVLLSGNFAGNDGGGMWTINGSTLTMVTFVNNSAENNGGGIFNNNLPIDPFDPMFSTLDNTTLWGNTATNSGQQVFNFNTWLAFRIENCDIQDSGSSGTSWDTSLGTDNGDNIDADPLFVDPVNDDLHLSDGSPAIDAGKDSNCPSTDLDGVQRPQGAGCDIGAFEFVPVALVKSVDNATPIPGEIITFTIKFSNPITETITSGLISDTLPAGLNFLDAITLDPPLSGTVGSEPPTLVSGLEISAGQQVTVTFPVSVSFGLTGGTQIINTAWVTSTEVITPAFGSTSITVANGSPLAVDDIGTGFITDEDTAIPTGSVLSNDSDPNGDLLTVQSFDTSGTKGLVTDNGDGTFEYDPDGQFEDLETGQEINEPFTYTISDGNGGTDTAKVTITISGVDDGFETYLPLLVDG